MAYHSPADDLSDRQEFLSSLELAAVNRGYEKATAEFFDHGHQVGLAVSRNGLSRAVRHSLPCDVNAILPVLDEWFAKREAAA